MSGWVLGRLVSGLGAATRDALLPLGRQACAEQSIWSPLLITSQTCRRWSVPAHASLSTSAAVNNAAQTASAGSADSSPLPGAAPAGSSGSDARPEAAAAATGDSSSSASSADSGAAPVAPAAPLPDPKPELVELLLSTEAAGNRPLQRKAARAEVMREFQRHPTDTGSPQVMVAMWTHRVRELVRHFDANKKQLHPMRELEMLVNRRQRMLTWLRRTDFESYSYTITKLGLKDIYTPTGQSDRYREGLRPEDPVVDNSVNRTRFNYLTKYKQKKTSLWAQLRPRLVSEDPSLAAADVASAAAEKLRQQQQRMSAAKAAV